MAKKELKSIEVSLLGSGESVKLTASDTMTDPIASYALDKFDEYDYMLLKNGENKYYVPFHAVDHIIVTVTEEEREYANPYGCEPDGSVGGSRVGC